MDIPSIPERDDDYKLLRLFHRSLIKRMCGKNEEALSLLDEINVRLGIFYFAPIIEESYSTAVKTAYNTLKDRYSVPKEIDELLFGLISEL